VGASRLWWKRCVEKVSFELGKKVKEIDASKFSLVTCICAYGIGIYFFAFSPNSEAYTIKLGHSQVLYILRHSGSDSPHLRWINDQLSLTDTI